MTLYAPGTEELYGRYPIPDGQRSRYNPGEVDPDTGIRQYKNLRKHLVEQAEEICHKDIFQRSIVDSLDRAHLILVMENADPDSNEVLGFATMIGHWTDFDPYDEPYLYLDYLCARPGHGRIILEEVREVAAQFGMATVELTSLPDAMGFYANEKVGFERRPDTTYSFTRRTSPRAGMPYTHTKRKSDWTDEALYDFRPYSRSSRQVFESDVPTMEHGCGDLLWFTSLEEMEEKEPELWSTLRGLLHRRERASITERTNILVKPAEDGPGVCGFMLYTPMVFVTDGMTFETHVQTLRIADMSILGEFIDLLDSVVKHAIRVTNPRRDVYFYDKGMRLASTLNLEEYGFELDTKTGHMVRPTS